MIAADDYRVLDVLPDSTAPRADWLSARECALLLALDVDVARAVLGRLTRWHRVTGTVTRPPLYARTAAGVAAMKRQSVARQPARDWPPTTPAA